MRYIISAFLRLRHSIRPDVRGWLDGFGMIVAVTLFFCLLQSAHDGIAKRNPAFDSERWWFPIYRALMM